MAASLELSVLLTSLCRILHPWRVVDLGSGFSSYVLRLYAAQAKPSPEVWSVDDSAEWLNKTREYLSALGLSTANLGTWEDFAASGQSGFDLILHDLGNMETRAGALPRVIELGRPGAMIVLDDVHKGTYRRAACAALRRRRLPCWSLRSFTLDRFGRYAWLTETR
jgi:predicted O-methyltransferase YrrM